MCPFDCFLNDADVLIDSPCTPRPWRPSLYSGGTGPSNVMFFVYDPPFSLRIHAIRPWRHKHNIQDHDMSVSISTIKTNCSGYDHQQWQRDCSQGFGVNDRLIRCIMRLTFNGLGCRVRFQVSDVVVTGCASYAATPCPEEGLWGFPTYQVEPYSFLSWASRSVHVYHLRRTQLSVHPVAIP